MIGQKRETRWPLIDDRGVGTSSRWAVLLPCDPFIRHPLTFCILCCQRRQKINVHGGFIPEDSLKATKGHSDGIENVRDVRLYVYIY